MAWNSNKQITMPLNEMKEWKIMAGIQKCAVPRAAGLALRGQEFMAVLVTRHRSPRKDRVTQKPRASTGT